MSPEQLIVLAGIFIALLVRAAQQATEAKRRESAAVKVRAEEVVGQGLPRREARPPVHRAAARAPRELPRRVSRPEAPASPARGPRDLRSLPSDLTALRRAIVLATILGPPRALKNATSLDSRER